MNQVAKLTKGYAIIPFDCQEIRKECIAAANEYFNQTLEKKKSSFSYSNQEERGYRHLEQKEAFFMRDSLVPEKLKCFVNLATRMHETSLSILRDIEKYLKLEENTITGLTHSTVWHAQKDRINESVLRIFRYYPNTKKTPCDSHEDLGLITVALKSTSPALEVLNLEKFEWEDMESSMNEKEAIVIIGESLSFLTHKFFPACTHQVLKTEKERYSFVYQLRLRHDAKIDSRKFHSPLNPIKNAEYFQTTGKEFFENIRSERKSVNDSY